MTVNILLLVPLTKRPSLFSGSEVRAYLIVYPVTSTFLSTHGTRPHVMVTLVGEGEETCTFVGGEEGAAGRNHGVE